MKTSGIASIAAAALSGAALFATSVTADLPPIVIKVRQLGSNPSITQHTDENLSRAPISSTRMVPNFLYEELLTSKTFLPMAQLLATAPSQIL